MHYIRALYLISIIVNLQCLRVSSLSNNMSTKLKCREVSSGLSTSVVVEGIYTSKDKEAMDLLAEVVPK